MDNNLYTIEPNSQPLSVESAIRNERFVEECLKIIHAQSNAEEGLTCLLRHLGETLGCERVYVFEEMDRQHVRNTYEWCRDGTPSGIEQLPYVAKKDLYPWYGRLKSGGNVIEPDVEGLRKTDPLIYELLEPQQIHSIILSPLLANGRMHGLLGADNPPPEKMVHISVVFDVLAYFVKALVGQRDLEQLRKQHDSAQKPKTSLSPSVEKTILLIDDSPQLLRLNERVLRPQGYDILCAKTLREAEDLLVKAQPDAIVLDVDLPDGDGITFCQKLRSRSDIPVVLLTARTDAQTAKAGINAGGCAFLTKPYLLEDLQEAVAHAVTGRTWQGQQNI